jgi:putative FmdB family regulatory protein
LPIYIFQCDRCVLEIEKIQEINGKAPHCPKCGGVMHKKFSPIAMIKMKGMGGYPSRRKEWRGTAPYTRGYDSTTDKNSEFYKGQEHSRKAKANNEQT